MNTTCPKCAKPAPDNASFCQFCGAPLRASAGWSPPAKIAVSIVVVLFLIGVYIGQPETQPSKLPSKTAPKKAPALVAPDSARIALEAPHRVTLDTLPAPVARPLPQSVYRSTASALYGDYMVNGVATRDKIGNSTIRISGWVSSIDLDPEENVVVSLYTGHDGSGNGTDPAQMLMRGSERATARTLHVLDRVRLLCQSMQLEGGLLMQGDRCVFLAVKHTPADKWPEAEINAEAGWDENFN